MRDSVYKEILLVQIHCLDVTFGGYLVGAATQCCELRPPLSKTMASEVATKEGGARTVGDVVKVRST